MADTEEQHVEEAHSRKERLTGSAHFGDTDFDEEQLEEIADATWGEVCTACCTHSGGEWGMIFVGLAMVIFCLYFFLLGLELLGTSAKVIGGCAAGALFGDETNPVAGLMIGILATVLIQSSSTTTSIIVSLVGAGTMSVNQAIYMVMGANIGTSVTNTIVAMGQMGDGGQLERAFGGATVHDMFNFLTVGVFFPIEVASHYLYHLTGSMLPEEVAEGDKWTGPLKKIVSPLGNRIIKANKKIIKSVAAGSTCESFYPTSCEGGVISYKTCDVGLIECDKSSNKCPLFFQNGAEQKDDEVSGGVCLFLGLVLLTSCLILLVSVLQKMLMGVSTRIIYKATNLNPYLAILVGTGITILVQSSSITTSVLTPLVGVGVIQLETMLPLTLGANIGTTFTALLASLVSSSVESLQVALCHLFFNLSGILVWFVVPFMRAIPLAAARSLGKVTRHWRFFPVVYILVIFFAIPLALLGVSELFTQKKKGFTVLGSFLVILIVCGAAYGTFWWKMRDGQEKCNTCISERERNSTYRKALPDDIDFLRAEIAKLKDHTGYADEEVPEKDEEAPLEKSE